MKLLILVVIALQLLFLNGQVISRNGKIEEMIKRVQESQFMFDNLIEESEKKVDVDYKSCISQMELHNCSQIDIWQHERAKHSKNITNMQQKLKSHQQTIYKIMDLNNDETKKKYLVIDRLLPQMIKLKNDIEFLDSMLFLIDDTYINVDNTDHSILEMFDSHFGHPIQAQLVQIMKDKKYFEHDPGVKPGQQDQLPQHPEEIQPEPQKQFNQGPPLIDEEIFDGQAPDYKISKNDPLFAAEGEAPLPPAPTADLIPDGVNVPEHDALEKSPDEMAEIMAKYKAQKEQEKREKEFENLQIDELEEEFKDSIKVLGGQMKERLVALRKTLSDQQDTLAQSVADIEHAMIELHHRHAKQIVQIYVEMKHLQKMIFEKDDIVLKLDGGIQDCSKRDEKTDNCNTIMRKTKQYTEQLIAQKQFNEALLKELQKLQSNYNDKMVEAPVVHENNTPDPDKLKKEAILKAQIDKASQEIAQIQAAEEQVAQSEEKEQIQKAVAKNQKKTQPILQNDKNEPQDIIDQVDDKYLIPQSSAFIAAQLEEKIQKSRVFTSKLKDKHKKTNKN